MDCIFCKIVDKEIPNYTLYEDETILAFLDIFPHAVGHTVVIPKKHGETIFDYDEVMIAELHRAIKKIMERLQTVLQPEGFTVGWNHGDAGGQAVPHWHVHIFPRWNGDGGGSMHSVVKKNDGINVAEIYKRFG
ncbi:MAG: hypothetical protein A2821_00530 [Candidatus Magasanikbacteria bacterium RIFCSPHIGHO2_01_FULL_41_23]|uniref:HIT domain-containing protein n=1 Tax=Candidatus Magasanikbacteria bacterium RIFCSPLOWO2_01_FULL_40_15 TaxID=1798686 RepID=A0A1F6N0B0_9BACT|nr:MAG: hypothetical protein A2821_00530 [Candidatus Magasanikbacteria bacterium RIFCSPHIGHO2_01_FULL_41_23]OGH74664.1 MAG: hypothetical protein A3F22_01885 [Candidatus Magasanikbacteria bacterium RIFCSPHIGHO2_12_FULL_41_16]OGH77377.1 MAG: hypothetical protein A2983_01585 [Candidatus Magasanikbacteria bacterium RIFCSPLOWO2_01_FULL_40_15]